MKQNWFFSAVSLAFLCSCAVSPQVEKSTIVQQEINGLRIYQMPLAADLKVSSERVEGIAEGKIGQLELVKRNAIFNALKTVSGDVMIEPHYTIDTHGVNVTVNVSGYYGIYQNFRNADYRESLDVDVKVKSVEGVVSKKSETTNSILKRGSEELTTIKSATNIVAP